MSLLAMVPGTNRIFLRACGKYYDHLIEKGVISSVSGGFILGIGMALSGSVSYFHCRLIINLIVMLTLYTIIFYWYLSVHFFSAQHLYLLRLELRCLILVRKIIIIICYWPLFIYLNLQNMVKLLLLYILTFIMQSTQLWERWQHRCFMVCSNL